MILGLDIGYANIKACWENSNRVTFPSVTGTPDVADWGVRNGNEFQIELDGKKFNIGESAMLQSTFKTRPEDRSWYQGQEYMALFLGALSEACASNAEIVLVTGLPVGFYKSDKDKLQERLQGIHFVKRLGRDPITINASKVYVVPQPAGTLTHVAFNNNGEVADASLALGEVGIVDIGGKTTNCLHASKLGNVTRETATFDIGGWRAVRALRPAIENLCPDGDYNDHEIALAMQNKSITYRGNAFSLDNPMREVLQPMAEEIADKANTLWRGGAKLDRIVITGGGAQLLGEYLVSLFEHANVTVIEDAMWANARGYYKLGVLKTKKQ